MRYWLMKSEPADVSIDDLAKLPNQTVDWYGVRNYQARNFMRDLMRIVWLIQTVCSLFKAINTLMQKPRKKRHVGLMWMLNWCAKHVC
jgi:predicted RNA-binding protein with PUA-like domain